MKKILIFSLNYYPKYVGGAEVAIKEIVERQDKNKYEFHMVTLRFDSSLPKHEIIHGIHIHRIGFTKKDATISDLKNSWLKYNKYFFQLFAAFYGLWLSRKKRFDVIWAIMAHSCGVPAGIYKIFSPKTKYILTLQEGDPPKYIESLAKPFPKFLFFLNWISFYFFRNGFLKADIIQSISTFLNDWAIKMGNKHEKVVIPNAVDIKQFTRNVSQQEIDEIRKILDKKDGETWLITTSRLVYKNGIDDVIKAVAKLDKKYQFAILGIGPDEENYKKLAKDLDIENRIHFIGQINHPSMMVCLKACDIFIRPSRSEGMGNSFVEAMSLKIPVIATTEGGLSDFIFDEHTAFVCKKDDPDSIVAAVEKIETFKKDYRLQMVLDNSYKMVKEKYDWDKIACQMEKEVFSII